MRFRFFFFSSRRRHTSCLSDWSSDVCSSDLGLAPRFEQQLRDRAGELGIADDVVFTGQVEHGSDYVSLLDVFVNASTPEPFGIVLLEAMAARVPVVAVRAGGPAEIVEDGVSGVLAPNGHPAHLADAIERLLDAPALRQA